MEWGELRQRLVDWGGRLIRFTRIKSAKSDGSCTVEGRTRAGGRAESSIPSRLVAPFGLRSVPPADLDAVELRAQASVYGSMTAPLDTKQYGPGDLAEDGSETALYNKDNERAVVAKGADVIVNEGNKKVATDTTPTANGTITVAGATSMAGVSTVNFTFTPPGGAPQTICQLVFTGTFTPGSVAMTGKVNGGDPHFLAPGP